ncbi:uncharacterized protein LOC126597754 isoform X7 [Malus sylvestris]|uniref:uncharacterized protein LOC126597754 isoform X2 n=1 Tax=Malus sylvestris TaxID=3752 RepID=UPI0021AC03FB|nr:uncharacterized protein LOC126597754 isoform X2 [Malus sylvestris]XP_050120657.1 uncharacterized protein LOC126597754 isoform X7 [Malus sylvestris]
MAPTPSLAGLQVETTAFPPSAKPPGSSNTLFLGGAGVRGLEIQGNFVKFTAIGVYLEENAVPLLAVKWKGKTAEELTGSVEFFRDIVTGPFEKFIQVTTILPLTGQQYSDKVSENCVAFWKSIGIYTDAEGKAIEKFLEVFKDQNFPPGASILFTQSPKGSLTISFSRDASVPEAANTVIENKLLSEAVLESIVGKHGVSPAAKQSLAERLSKLLNGCNESKDAKAGNEKDCQIAPPPSLAGLQVETTAFPPSVKPPGSSNTLFLGGAGVRGLEIQGNFVKFTAIGVYLEDNAVPQLAVKWKGKTAEELMESVEFFRDIVTGPFEKFIQVTTILPLTGQQYSDKVSENCVVFWKSVGIYTDAEGKAIEKFLEVFKDQNFPPGASILFTQSPKGSLTISFSRDASVPEAANTVIENKLLSDAVLESIVGKHGVSPAAKQSLAGRLSELLNGCNESNDAKAGNEKDCQIAPPPSLAGLQVETTAFPPSVKPPGSPNTLFLGGAGVRGLEIQGNFVKFTAIGVYLEDNAVPQLAVKWKGKTAKELTESVEFFRDIVTGPFEKFIQVTTILPLTGQQYSEKVSENCTAFWKLVGIYTDAEGKAIEMFLEVFKDQNFPPGASILFTQSPKGSLTISFSRDASVPEAANVVIENKLLSEAVLESIVGKHGVSPAAKQSLATRLSELLNGCKESNGVEAGNERAEA